MTDTEVKSAFEAIPADMCQLDQWINWKLVPESDGKARKLPVQPNGKATSTTDFKTWTNFKNVVAASSKFSGIGFVFSPEDPFCGIDLDNVRDPATGIIQQWALEIIERFSSYTEISQSGRGVHIIIRAKIPDGRGRKRDGLEVYDRGRYFAMTGKILR